MITVEMIAVRRRMYFPNLRYQTAPKDMSRRTTTTGNARLAEPAAAAVSGDAFINPISKICSDATAVANLRQRWEAGVKLRGQRMAASLPETVISQISAGAPILSGR